ncbi:diguanylate cyclase [Roseospira marina]|uniref:diguanylate cyclase n=1 Tax=Roseospira marina TaxID=140057 RepID=A0A5M6IER5_9PROT|nr:diguanylate cyclase [Roseospira marina]KAA5606205.1 diguanylate cyclase [Roseospira marina]MBB4314352.1 diguanylate cyclase (GGDEF)-like protein [Roseospira marina]MBB5087512.1 diguanylate cyclase (GGDEF)-like protein [Roseospira marina]
MAGTDVRPTVLIVEDDPSTLRLLSSIFRDSYDLVVATEGREAYAVARAEQPDLMLLDLNLPDIDGLQVCRTFKAEPDLQHIPIIFLTGDQNPATEEKGITLGAMDFVTKPFTAAVLQARVRTHIDLRRKTMALETLAGTDALTGVPNRRSFDEVAEREWRRMARERSPLSLVMVDIDHFKGLNDTFGHPFGDHVLRRVAAAVREQLRRPGDYLARFGGEEFVLVLPATDRNGAGTVAENVRLAIGALRFDDHPGAADLRVTASLGCSTDGEPKRDVDGIAALLSAADQNLYRAKRSGRNRVENSPAAAVSDETSAR